MELKDYTTEELKAELKRRKAQKAETMENALKCRNCKHCVHHPSPYVHTRLCEARTWGKTYPRHYCVKPYTKACDKFERKMED